MTSKQARKQLDELMWQIYMAWDEQPWELDDNAALEISDKIDQAKALMRQLGYSVTEDEEPLH